MCIYVYVCIYIYVDPSHMYIFIKAFTSKAIFKIFIQLCSFFKARDIVQKIWVSEATHKKSLQKHLKSGICWKGNAYYPAFSCFAGWSCPGIFFYSNIYTDCLVPEFRVLEHLCSASLYHINFKKTSYMSRKWKIDWGCECLVRMQS